MAIIICPDCKKGISHTVEVCPFCGRRIQKKSMGIATKIILAILGMGFFSVVGSCGACAYIMHDSSNSQIKQERKTQAAQRNQTEKISNETKTGEEDKSVRKLPSGRTPEDAKKFIDSIKFEGGSKHATALGLTYAPKISEIIENNFPRAKKARVYSSKFSGEAPDVEIYIVLSPLELNMFINKHIEELAFAAKEIASSTKYNQLTFHIYTTNGFDPKTGKPEDVQILWGILKASDIKDLEQNYFRNIPQPHKTFVEAYHIGMLPELRESLR